MSVVFTRMLQDIGSSPSSLELNDAVLVTWEPGQPIEAFSITARESNKSKPKKVLLVAASEAEKDEWVAAVQTVLDLQKVYFFFLLLFQVEHTDMARDCSPQTWTSSRASTTAVQ
jgi:hypothetical protein